ncbi:MAG: hypothetical protein PHN82_04815 [bacterium]|nr:hypothetical protein [bacterium]
MDISADEIKEGLVLFLDPEILIAKGATCSVPDNYRARKSRPFLCIDADSSSGTCIPLYSSDAKGRGPIEEDSKEGDDIWIVSDSYYDTRQQWNAVAHETIIAAARGDQSTTDLRNTVTPECLRDIKEDYRISNRLA